MEALNANDLKLFKWVNEPAEWNLTQDILSVTTDNKTDFWQHTWYKFYPNTGHLFGKKVNGNFCFSVCVEAEFTTLYDQAGLMVYVDSKHWLKSGIEHNDGQPMIGNVMTNEVSDWATGVFTGNPRKFWIRITKLGDVVCVKYSTDNITWILLRLCQFPPSENVLVGPMCCSPQRQGLEVKFSDFKFGTPAEDILHSN
ncbi:uncharacterized protein LOC106142128 [Amyelois transitella]|uniref:uncharacterized protein LOC106142128 n=1 Tax=Amyelois transitella TaxID=680683 RepID=UPI00067D8A60|nr:uncharacterized protein LOC106142128 [Amyelois transitella]